MFTKKTTFLPYFMDGFVDGSALRFLEVLKDSRILRISGFVVTELGVFPLLFGVLGLSVKGANILTISVSSSDDPNFQQILHIYLEY